jgi:UDP-2-acetamido-2-deoxy-ribo-hexuluronate aminotransferase
MDAINGIAEKYDHITVIEDAAQSFGSTYKRRRSCNISEIGCTSFFPSKPLGCYGDGGAIFTNDDGVAKRSKEIRIHGQSKRYVHTSVGVGGRMDTLQCAIVLAKLERFDWELQARTKVARQYYDLITNSVKGDARECDQSAFTCVDVGMDCESVYGQFSIICEDRGAIISRLESAGIPYSIHYPVPINEQPAYIDSACSQPTPNAHLIAQKILSLPMSPYLSWEEQERVICAVMGSKF